MICMGGSYKSKHLQPPIFRLFPPPLGYFKFSKWNKVHAIITRELYYCCCCYCCCCCCCCYYYYYYYSDHPFMLYFLYKCTALSTNQMSDLDDFWKNECKKLELEVQHRDDEITSLQSHIKNLTSCVISFQNKIRPYIILSSVFQQKQTATYHPDSQQSSSCTESDSDSTVTYSDCDTTSPTFDTYAFDDHSPTPVNFKHFTSPSEATLPSILPEAFCTNKPTSNLGSNFKPKVPTNPPNLGSNLKPKIQTSAAQKDAGMDLMRRQYEQVQKNEMTENIMKLEDRCKNK